MSTKWLQSIFLIIGTAIGAGILALPISTVSCGFLGSIVALVLTWLFMTFSASSMIKARLCFKEEVDLATMTTELLGRSSNFFIEFCYLALLIALSSMYITVGSTWVIELTTRYLEITLSAVIAQIAFTFAIACIIYSGLGNLAKINQFITGAKLFFLIMIIFISAPDIQMSKLNAYSLSSIPSTFSLLLTTFGFSIILPSLAGFLKNDAKKLNTALVIGSMVILVIYFAWELIAFGVIGSDLASIANSQDKGTGVINALTSLVHNPSVTTYGTGVMLTAVLTSFLGVGQCLFSYLKDTLPMQNASLKAKIAILVGFITPLIIINIYPAGISSILGFAGIFVAIILGLLPNAMILSKKYKKLGSPLSLFQKIMATLSLLFFSMVIFIECWYLFN